MDNNYNEIIGQRINAALALSNIKQKNSLKNWELRTMLFHIGAAVNEHQTQNKL